MGRSARDKRPQVKPVQKIELSWEKSGLRAVAAVVCLLVGAGALVYAVSQLFTTEPGWQTIQAGTSDGTTCGDEFVFLYEVGASGRSAREESRTLTQLYTQACRKAYQLFHTSERFEGVVNLKEINDHPNEVLTVDEVLYRAFETVQGAGNRTLYLGPVYARYSDLFLCGDDAQLVDFDPRLSPEVAEEYAAIAAYAQDPEAIGVELLEDSQICLRVSEDYLAYAQREGIERFLDFGWMRNAFAADYLAETMVEAGFTCGTISSYDGFARCLDSREGTYALPLPDWLEDRPIEAGTLEYQGPMSLVSLRGFPAAEGDEYRYYRLKNGEVRTLYLDPADGVSKLYVDSVTCYSPAHSCAELAMALGRAFIADAFHPEPMLDLIREEAVVIECWSEEHAFIVMGEGEAVITNLYEYAEGRHYTVD